jgi:UDP-N-acetylglucosamine 4,6-dehydratase/5-epimerase
MFNKKNILITGGTGSFGQECVKFLSENYKPNKIIIFSRDENKQYEMQKTFTGKNIRFFIGDIRDKERLRVAMREVNYVIHAAALKHVPIAEYNPTECIKTNINGAENLVETAIEAKVERVLALSTDKAVDPVNLYGATKLCAEKLFIAANNLAGKMNTRFSVVRYGNVLSSRGSVLPFYLDLLKKEINTFPITDVRMTRFFINLPDAVKFVLKSMQLMKKGEIFIPKMPSFKIQDLAYTLNPKVRLKKIGMRPGEKLHEMLISEMDSAHTYELNDLYIILPEILKSNWSNLRRVKTGFIYKSNVNKNFFDKKYIKKLLQKSKINISRK